MKGYGTLKECMIEGLNIESMKKSDLVLMDCRKPLSKANKEELVSILRSIGFLKQREGMKHFYRYAVRILMSPTPDLIHTIQSERETMDPSRYPIGVHARCGGMLSDVHESRAMVTPSILKTIPRRVKRLIKESRIPKRKVYVYHRFSTVDSSEINDSVSPRSLREHRGAGGLVASLHHRVVSDGVIKECSVVLSQWLQSRDWSDWECEHGAMDSRSVCGERDCQHSL